MRLINNLREFRKLKAENRKKPLEGRKKPLEDNLIENISIKDLANIASGASLVPDDNLHILNYFAYSRNLTALKCFLQLFKDKRLRVFLLTDNLHGDVLDISLKSIIV